VYLPERLHAVRIAVKKLRYGTELAVESGAARLPSELAALKRMQQLLGRMHDLQVLIDRVRAVQAEPARPSPSSRELDAVVLALDRSCRRLHARYIRERDGLIAICDRLGARGAKRRTTAANASQPAVRRAG
jgi:CHAD domain-containing protein